jgi:hypothetical protein
MARGPNPTLSISSPVARVVRTRLIAIPGPLVNRRHDDPAWTARAAWPPTNDRITKPSVAGHTAHETSATTK